jgi:predicted membrane protein
MIPQDDIKKDVEKNSRNTVGRGMIFLLVGGFFLIRNLNLGLPDWVMSWEVLVMGIGAIIWTSSNFRNHVGLIMIAVGGAFLTKELLILSFDITRFIWPVILMIIGVAFIFRKNTGGGYRVKGHRYNRYHETIIQEPSEDFIQASAVFSGVNRIVVSKTFKGGSVDAVFGGCDLNLTQADFNGTVVLQANAVFGGIELIVPSNWEIKTSVDTVFGSIEDKRPVELMTTNPDKVLIIKGSCVFGGIEIKSY